MARIRFDRRALRPDATLSTWAAADGWPLRRFDWPASSPARGRILFVGGRGDVIEKYLEAFGQWHEAGWGITSFDWRGQGGSGRVADDRHVGHIDDFASYVRDLTTFWEKWRSQATGPAVVIAHSMGGHIALRAMVEAVIAPDAAVLIAPMLGLHSPVGERLGGVLAHSLARIGGPTRSAWKHNELPAVRASRQALLTGDADRYADELWWQDTRPELKLGPPSWGWVAQAFASIRALACDPRLATLDVPILMLVAEHDRLVRSQSAIEIAGKLRSARLVRFGPESAHEILREADAVRDRALDEIDRFLDPTASAR